MQDYILQYPHADEETKLQFWPIKWLTESKPDLAGKSTTGIT
jgi:hypothetical protein